MCKAASIRRLFVPVCATALLAAVTSCTRTVTVVAGSPGSSTAVASGASTAVPSQNQSATQTFPDGTKVAFVSSKWTALNPDIAAQVNAPYGVNFTFHVLAGSQWSHSKFPQLCLNCDEEPGQFYYKVTIPGWTYLSNSSNGIVSLAGGGTGSFNIGSGIAVTLASGDSGDTTSTLVPPSALSGEQRVTVTIEMPSKKVILASETFTVNVSPNPYGAKP